MTHLLVIKAGLFPNAALVVLTGASCRMQPYSTWRVPTTSYRSSPPRALYPSLTHHTSMLDLHDQGWARSDSPSTPSSSSSSGYEGGVITPTASSSDFSTPERSTTPKPPPSPPVEFRTQLFGQYSRNPFFRQSRPSPPVSPKSLPSSHVATESRSPPDSSSRCPTPVAPTPVRPVTMPD